jgi:hypothetical protein
VRGEGRSLGSARVGSGSEAGSEVGFEGIFVFSFFALLGVSFLFRGDGLLDGMVWKCGCSLVFSIILG